MRVISNKSLVVFAVKHPEAEIPLQAWRRIVEEGDFLNFAALKRSFNGVDKVGDFCVFDIGGNKFRLVAAVHFNRHMLFIRHVFTHKEYDTWKR
jgi:mRNA interferase HigB